MHIKHVVPTNDTQSSRTRMWPFSATLLLIAGGTWLARALQARSMGLMPVSIGTHSLAKNQTGDVLTFEVRERQRTGGCISSLIAQQEDQARTVSPKLCKSQ